jgi:alpha-N-acetylglucosaminidase
VIDLGATGTLGAMHITFYHADGRTYTFKLELSTDGKAWKEVAGNLNDAKPATAEGLRLNFEPTAARYARLTVVKNSANFAVHVQELKLFAVSTL